MIKRYEDYLIGKVKGKEEVIITLPSQAPYCLYCRLLQSETYLDRHTCMLTDRFVFNPKRERDACCPVEWEE